MPRLRTIVHSCLAATAGIVALEHVVRPDLPPLERFISEYGRGSTQPLHVAAFGAWTVANGGCAALAGSRRGPRAARAATACGFAAAALGTLVAAVFATQTVGGELPAGVARTTAGRLHDMGTLLILGGLVVAGMASTLLISTRRYRLIALALATGLFAIVPALLAFRLDAPGLGQRGFVLVGWLFGWAFASHAGAEAPPR